MVPTSGKTDSFKVTRGCLHRSSQRHKIALKGEESVSAILGSDMVESMHRTVSVNARGAGAKMALATAEASRIRTTGARSGQTEGQATVVKKRGADRAMTEEAAT